MNISRCLSSQAATILNFVLLISFLYSFATFAHIPEQYSLDLLVFELSINGVFYNLLLVFNILFLKFTHDSMQSCTLFSVLYHLLLYKYFIVYPVAS